MGTKVSNYININAKHEGAAPGEQPFFMLSLKQQLRGSIPAFSKRGFFGV